MIENSSETKIKIFMTTNTFNFILPNNNFQWRTHLVKLEVQFCWIKIPMQSACEVNTCTETYCLLLKSVVTFWHKNSLQQFKILKTFQHSMWLNTFFNQSETSLLLLEASFNSHKNKQFVSLQQMYFSFSLACQRSLSKGH